MKQDPIYTVITNHTGKSFLFPYTGKGAVWLFADKPTTVPYELWSAAKDEKMRSGLLSALVSGRISLEVYLLNADGDYTRVEFAPYKAFGFETSEPKDIDEEVKVKDITVAEPPKEEPPAEESPKEEPPAEEPPKEEATNEEAIDDSVPANEESPDNNSDALWTTYSECVANKQWAAAAEALISLGAENVTARALMALKDKSVEAVKAKYSLA